MQNDPQQSPIGTPDKQLVTAKIGVDRDTMINSENDENTNNDTIMSLDQSAPAGDPFTIINNQSMQRGSVPSPAILS